MSNLTRLIECVPNFSEGRNMDVINQITSVIERAKGVKLTGRARARDEIRRDAR